MATIYELATKKGSTELQKGSRVEGEGGKEREREKPLLIESSRKLSIQRIPERAVQPGKLVLGKQLIYSDTTTFLH